MFDNLYNVANANLNFRNFRDKVIEVRKVAKVTEAGRKMQFRVTVATGDG